MGIDQPTTKVTTAHAQKCNFSKHQSWVCALRSRALVDEHEAVKMFDRCQQQFLISKHSTTSVDCCLFLARVYVNQVL